MLNPVVYSIKLSGLQGRALYWGSKWKSNLRVSLATYPYIHIYLFMHIYKIHVLVWHYSSTSRSDSLDSLYLLQEIITSSCAEKTSTCVAYHRRCNGSLRKIFIFLISSGCFQQLISATFTFSELNFFFNLFSTKSCSDGKNCWMHLVCICSKRWITKSDYKVERVNKRSILSMGKETDFFLYQLQRKLLGNEKHQRIAFDFKGFKCNLEGLQQYTAMQHQYILDLSSWSRDAKQKLKLFLELFWDLSSQILMNLVKEIWLFFFSLLLVIYTRYMNCIL